MNSCSNFIDTAEDGITTSVAVNLVLQAVKCLDDDYLYTVDVTDCCQ